jgi:hypothetical protein
LSKRPSLAQSEPMLLPFEELGEEKDRVRRLITVSARRRNSSVVLSKGRSESPPPMPMVRSRSRPDLLTGALISQPDLTMAGMDEADKATWDSLEASYGGAAAAAKFESHVPALISPHPKSAPAEFCVSVYQEDPEATKHNNHNHKHKHKHNKNDNSNNNNNKDNNNDNGASVSESINIKKNKNKSKKDGSNKSSEEEWKHHKSKKEIEGDWPDEKDEKETVKIRTHHHAIEKTDVRRSAGEWVDAEDDWTLM